MNTTLPALALGLLLLPGSAFAQSKQPEQRALDMVRALGADTCYLLHQKRDDDVFAPELYQFSYRGKHDDVAQDYQLVRVPCWTGAYNQGDAYVLFDPYGEASLVSFATPDFDVTYVDEDLNEQVQSMRLTGYSARLTVVLSHFDPQTLTIHEYNKSRGVGDASTSGVWIFHEGDFSLRSYAVDATYDEEINPKTMVDFGESQ